jgi:uncharacterized protein
VTFPIGTEFDLVVRRGTGRGDREPRDDEAVTDNYIIVGAKEHEIQLHAHIHENVVVSIPMLILCDEQCRGLCPECGANHNHTDCSCRRESAGD